MPLILYGDPFSAATRFVTCTLEWLHLKYDFKYVDVKRGENLAEKFQKVNPFQTVPFLVDGNFKLSEGKAIAMYLVNQYGGDKDLLYPKAPMERAKVDEMLFYDANVINQKFQNLMLPVLHGQAVEEENLNSIMGLLHLLTKRVAITGYMAMTEKLSLADLSIFVMITTLDAIELVDLDSYEGIRNWLAHCKKEIPNSEVAYQRGINRVIQFYNTKVGRVEEV